jgi:hypothetical protein
MKRRKPYKPLRRYEVTVCRISYQFHTQTVTARSEAEAKELALDAAGNYLYNEKHVDYEVEGVTRER